MTGSLQSQVSQAEGHPLTHIPTRTRWDGAGPELRPPLSSAGAGLAGDRGVPRLAVSLKSKAFGTEHSCSPSEKQLEFEATEGGVVTKTTESREARCSLLSGDLNLLNPNFLMKIPMSETQ